MLSRNDFSSFGLMLRYVNDIVSSLKSKEVKEQGPCFRAMKLENFDSKLNNSSKYNLPTKKYH